MINCTNYSLGIHFILFSNNLNSLFKNIIEIRRQITNIDTHYLLI